MIDNQAARVLAFERKAKRVAQAVRGGNLRDIPEEYISVERTFMAPMSAYSSSPDECSGNPNVTASGARTHWGTVASSSNLPFGTKLRIKDIDPDAIFTVEDRGGAIQGNRLDIWYPSKAAALQFGRRTLEVEVLSLGI
ncbi:3D domain-containing protein [Patescibacteria group bacterium]